MATQGVARSRLDRLEERLGRLDEFLDRHWLSLLVATVVVVFAGATAGRFLLTPFAVNRDSALFQHAGWYVLQGATPYVDFFDVKPPLIYAVTAVLAALSGGNMAVLHLLSVAVGTAAVGAGVVLVGVLTHRLTGDGTAAYAAGVSLFVFPTVYAFPSLGIRPKYLAFCFGMGALVLAVDDRPGASGAAAAASAGFWQLGVLVAGLVVAVGYRRGGRRGAALAVAGGVAVAAAVVAPFVAAGLVVPLVVETVVAPVYAVERYTLAGRLLEAIVEVGVAGVALLVVGAYGWIRGLDRAGRYWWVAVGGAAYALQALLEMQGAIELVFLFAFVGVGAGAVVAGRRSSDRRLRVLAVVILLAAANGYWAAGPVTPIKDEVEAAQESVGVSDYERLPERPADAPSMSTVYWEKRRPERCHYRFGKKQRYFAAETGGSLEKSRCGQWPFASPPREWLLERALPG
ncbi:DolP-mannose mannosyltransferase [Natronomonas marina]|uniref:DolP-mannose mannosyltransferase n=1 Tax=Natronomonas marina TaxID=2961939 RepID=UPI0020C97DA8|nr:DolP-mannose mannosyltransferase [Natronomonas marina]